MGPASSWMGGPHSSAIGCCSRAGRGEALNCWVYTNMLTNNKHGTLRQQLQALVELSVPKRIPLDWSHWLKGAYQNLLYALEKSANSICLLAITYVATALNYPQYLSARSLY